MFNTVPKLGTKASLFKSSIYHTAKVYWLLQNLLKLPAQQIFASTFIMNILLFKQMAQHYLSFSAIILPDY